MAFWPFPSGYPAVLDNFLVSQVDGLDVVWANHPNSLASAIMTLQAKLNIDNGQVQNTGGLAFDPVGHIANPAPAGVPSLWIDTTTAPSYALMYTDELGNDYDLRGLDYQGYFSYVDAVFGSDLGGDGTWAHPYRTLPYACSQVAVPTTEEEFVTPVTFHLAPGNYTGPIVLPPRLAIKIVGDRARITGDIEWPLDPQWWLAWGVTQFPSLSIVNENTSWFGDGLQQVCEPKYSSGLRLEDGTLVAYNSNPIGSPLPMAKILSIVGCVRAGFNIYNQPTGTADANDVVQRMNVNLVSSPHDFDSPYALSWICGEADRGSGTYYDNAVIVRAEKSHFSLLGCCFIEYLRECWYYANYTLDHAMNPYQWGIIGSYDPVFGLGIENIRDSYAFDECFFGYDPSAPAPVTATTPTAIVFDRMSLVAMAQFVTDLTVSFYGFKATSPFGAHGRGWFNGTAEAGYGPGTASTLRVPTFDDGKSENVGGALLRHTYGCAVSWMPHGQPLTATNPLTIELESGLYRFFAAFDCSNEYIHLVGKGSLQDSMSRPEVPSTQLYVGHTGLLWGASWGRLENVDIQGYGDTYGGEFCMKMMGAAANSTFKNVTFTNYKYPLYAVVIDPAVPAIGVQATWIDCFTKLDGFLFGGNVAGSFSRCKAANYSFGAWASTTAVRNIVCSGSFEDCVGGQRCFGAVEASGAGGGTAQFTGSAIRCVVSQRGYGYAYHPTTAYNAQCVAKMIDCDNTGVSGGRSFGYSENGEGLAGGTFLRCRSGEKSFGCSSAAATYRGIFMGDAQDCEAGVQSFGSNVADPTLSSFTGQARRCRADYQSFGSRGQFSGRAYKCEASYGSFGWQTTFAKAILDDCTISEILSSASGGPPGIFGATVRNCYFYSRNGQNVAPLVVLGGLEAANQESRVYNCDLYSDTYIYGIAASGGAFDVQVAHSRMRVDLDPNLNNILADPHNVVDANYDPN